MVELPCRVTPREIQVIRLLTVGNTAAEIALQLEVSRHTVRTHIRNIYAKLGLDNRLDLLRWEMAHLTAPQGSEVDQARDGR